MEPKSGGEGGFEVMLQPFEMMIAFQRQNYGRNGPHLELKEGGNQ